MTEGPLDPEIAAYLERLAVRREPRAHQGSVAAARRRLAARRAAAAPPPPMREVEDLACEGPGGELRCRLYRPPGEADLLVVYFHGGGWTVGDLDTADATARRLAARLGADLVSVDYRLAPEHPFPAALRDAEAAVPWAARRFAAGRPLVLAGDSAGGNLAAVCAADREALGPPIAAQLLNYPVTDCDFGRPSYAIDGGLYPLGSSELRWYWDNYLPEPACRLAPQASPLRRDDLSRAAPAVIVLAGHDPLRDEGRRYAERLREAGVPVRLLEFEGAVHGFLGFPGEFRIRRLALEEAARAVRELAVAAPVRLTSTEEGA